MNELSFDIKTTNDLFQVLLEDYKEFSLNRTSSRHALHCAFIAWHMTEWIYSEFNITEKFNTLRLFQESIKKQCESLQIMNDLADGTKHYQLSRKYQKVKATELHNGVFSKEFSREFDTSHLILELSDGTKIYFEDEIKKVISFWTEYITHNIG